MMRRWVLEIPNGGVKLRYTREMLELPWICIKKEDLDIIKSNPKGFSYGDGSERAKPKRMVKFIVGSTISKPGHKVALRAEGDISSDGVKITVDNEPFTLMPNENVMLVANGNSVVKLADDRYWAEREIVSIIRRKERDERPQDD